jgi:hypothetical protein
MLPYTFFPAEEITLLKNTLASSDKDHLFDFLDAWEDQEAKYL